MAWNTDLSQVGTMNDLPRLVSVHIRGVDFYYMFVYDFYEKSYYWTIVHQFVTVTHFNGYILQSFLGPPGPKILQSIIDIYINIIIMHGIIYA